MGVILLKQTTGTSTSGSSGNNPAYTESEKLILEMEMEFKTSNLENYKELQYDVEGYLSNVSIWYDNTKALKIFNKDFNYNNGYLESTLLKRISDSALLLRTFEYTNGSLTSVTTSASI